VGDFALRLGRRGRSKCGRDVVVGASALGLAAEIDALSASGLILGRGLSERYGNAFPWMLGYDPRVTLLHDHVAALLV
jgi:hypothetical protein